MSIDGTGTRYRAQGGFDHPRGHVRTPSEQEQRTYWTASKVLLGLSLLLVGILPGLIYFGAMQWRHMKGARAAAAAAKGHFSEGGVAPTGAFATHRDPACSELATAFTLPSRSLRELSSAELASAFWRDYCRGFASVDSPHQFDSMTSNLIKNFRSEALERFGEFLLPAITKESRETLTQYKRLHASLPDGIEDIPMKSSGSVITFSLLDADGKAEVISFKNEIFTDWYGMCEYIDATGQGERVFGERASTIIETARRLYPSLPHKDGTQSTVNVTLLKTTIDDILKHPGLSPVLLYSELKRDLIRRDPNIFVTDRSTSVETRFQRKESRGIHFEKNFADRSLPIALANREAAIAASEILAYNEAIFGKVLKDGIDADPRAHALAAIIAWSLTQASEVHLYAFALAGYLLNVRVNFYERFVPQATPEVIYTLAQSLGLDTNKNEAELRDMIGSTLILYIRKTGRHVLVERGEDGTIQVIKLVLEARIDLSPHLKAIIRRERLIADAVEEGEADAVEEGEADGSGAEYPLKEKEDIPTIVERTYMHFKVNEDGSLVSAEPTRIYIDQEWGAASDIPDFYDRRGQEVLPPDGGILSVPASTASSGGALSSGSPREVASEDSL